jgi:L-asparagine transporter-like permease
LFQSQLTIKEIIAIIIIIAASSLIIMNKNKEKGNGKKRLLYTLGAFFCWSFLALTLTYLTLEGLASTQILFYITFFVSCIIGIEIVCK